MIPSSRRDSIPGSFEDALLAQPGFAMDSTTTDAPVVKGLVHNSSRETELTFLFPLRWLVRGAQNR